LPVCRVVLSVGCRRAASSGWCFALLSRRIECRLTLKLLRSIRTEDLCTGSSSILLSIAWLAATPPGTAPGEEAHYVVRQLLSVTAVGGVAVQITGRSTAARRNSVGISGPWLFPSAAGAWSPPAGWPLLILVAILACSILAASVVRYAAQGGRSKDLAGTDPAAVALYVSR
jgi:hypothetical protein